MEILRPELMWVDGRCYRKNFIEKTEDVNPEETEDPMFVEGDDGDYETCDTLPAIEQTDSGYRAKVDVPEDLLKFLIGRKGDTKRRLESETKAQLKIPRQGEKGPVVVQGVSRRSVVSALTRVELLTSTGRRKLPFTHFLSIPVTADNIRKEFGDFKVDVLLQCDGDRGMEASLFQNPKKLHLTLGTLTLLSDLEVEKAGDLLQTCGKEVIGPLLGTRGLEVDVQGLEYMNDDPNMVDVLYMKVQPREGSDRLQQLADQVVQRFVRHDLMVQQYDRVKLHVTALNTRFRQDPSAVSTSDTSKTSQGKNRQAQGLSFRESFDASNILRRFRDYNFGTCFLNELHLSQRYSEDKSTGYYVKRSAIFFDQL